MKSLVLVSTLSLALPLVLVSPPAALAQPVRLGQLAQSTRADQRLSQSEPARTPIERTDRQSSQRVRARLWNLTEADWQRYETVMTGPRGLWSPDLDPILVLGIHARSEAERQRFAELAVEQEQARVAGELAFQRAYDEAWDRLYPDRMLVEVSRLARADRTARMAGSSAASSGATPLPEMLPGDRLLLFLSPDCGPCAGLARRLSEWVPAARAGLDFYLLGTDAQGVQDWARTLGLPPGPVGKGSITLNLDGGTLARLTAGAGTPPLLVRRSLGQFTVLPLEGLLP